MPRTGERKAECSRGHDLTLPGARCKPGPTRRGAGACRLCQLESKRRYNGSTKTGPPSSYRGDSTAQLAALAAGKKVCSRCGGVKERDQFSRSAKHPTGLHSWCKGCCSEQKRTRYQQDREEINLKSRAARFGITPDALRKLITEYDGCCAICGGPCSTGRQLAVDHDHVTGQVRGLLCAKCNRGIGLLRDSAAVAQAAANYLRRWERDVEGQPGVRDPGLSVAS